MDRFNRIFALHTLLSNARYPISRDRLMEKLECSHSTLKRILREMRDDLGAPIVYRRDYQGYCYEAGANTFQLPGLWFNASELYALLAMQQLLNDVQPGFLAPHLRPLRARIERILQSQHMGSGEITGRIRLLQVAARHTGAQHFSVLAEALVKRSQVRFEYRDRQHNTQSVRTVSPQRLSHYRDNWYLDAWCHTRKGLRTFALERMRAPKATHKPARDIDEARLNRHFAAGYGIFAGAPRHTARLRFSAQRARWVAEEKWHREQRGQWCDDGSYQLEIPYSDPRELIMDILKYGPDVTVIAPPDLVREVKQRLEAAAAMYQ